MHNVKVSFSMCNHTVEYSEAHIWLSTWYPTEDGSMHYRLCEMDCGARNVLNHSIPLATCVTPQVCSDCKASSTNPQKHEGTITTTYKLSTVNEYQHFATDHCSACKQSFGSRGEDHTYITAATCRRDGSYARTVDCVRIPYVLLTGDVRTELVLCPVCGEISQIREIDENGENVGVIELNDEVRLLLVEDARAKAVTERLPAGELVLRMGAREEGDNLLSVAFERSGKLTQPTGQVKITLPAEALEGYALILIEEDGTEAELPFEVEEELASFALDFIDSLSPARLIRLVPLV